VAVDLIAVDVQVIDRDGHPVAGLGPDKFEVTINGRRRRVVSAEFIGSQRTATSANASPASASPASASPPVSPPAATPTTTAATRTIVLAVDCISFDPGASRGAVEAAREFVMRLPPGDHVGLFAYPAGPKVDPTTDRAAVVRALDAIVGQREMNTSTFYLRPSDIIDTTQDVFRGGGPTLDALARRECGDPPEATCVLLLTREISMAAVQYEGQANASLGMLRSLLKEMGSVAGRKTLVLVSGGMLASDSPGGRPDLGELGILLGKEAARANTAIYTLFIDTTFLAPYSAQTKAGGKAAPNLARDGAVLGRWLEQFSGAAGGSLFKVMAGTGGAAYDRILTETTSYYLLGVEPAEADRDGRSHELQVKSTQRNVTVRGRKWVSVPVRGSTATAVGATTAPASSMAKPAVSPVLRVVPPEVKTLADLFDRGDYAEMQRTLAQTRDLANLIRTFRTSDSPWPNAPRRATVFALEIAIAGLRTNNQHARDEGGRVLAEYNTLVRQPADTGPALGKDGFECSWLWAEVAALEGLFMPESAMLFVPRAVQRCPDAARLHLAYGMVTEQQWQRGTGSPAEAIEVMRRYEEAMKFPETDVEARVRAAWFLHRTGQFARALALVDGASGRATDRQVRYLADLVRGQALGSLGRLDEAVAAFDAALATWPGAQSARVALMTLLVTRGQRDKAAALADAAETAPDDQFDPWWTYWLGDYRMYPAIVGKLREVDR
jgi:VWFA-related protein